MLIIFDLVVHRGQYISEEDLYGLISDYGEVELMTDAEGGDLEELPVFPSNIWIKYRKKELNNISNPIFSLNKADLSISHTSYLRIWTHDRGLRCFKNISGEPWRRGRWDVVKEADVEGLIEDGTKITVIQPACFGAGCYIEMATSYHQPHEYELVGG